MLRFPENAEANDDKTTPPPRPRRALSTRLAQVVGRNAYEDPADADNEKSEGEDQGYTGSRRTEIPDSQEDSAHDDLSRIEEDQSTDPGAQDFSSLEDSSDTDDGPGITQPLPPVSQIPHYYQKYSYLPFSWLSRTPV